MIKPFLYNFFLLSILFSCQSSSPSNAGQFQITGKNKYSIKDIRIDISEFTLTDFEPMDFNEFMVTGYVWSSDTNDDFACAKVDERGNIRWVQLDNNPGHDQGRFITKDKKGLFMIGGFKFDSLNNRQMYVQKTTPLGKTWGKSYEMGKGVSDEAYNLIELHNGDYLITGFTKANLKSALLRISRQGAIMKKGKYGGDHKDYLFDAIELDNSDIISVGAWGGFFDETGNDFTVKNSDIMIVKTNKALKEKWLKRIDHGGHDYAHRIFPSDANHVFIAGTSQQNDERSFDFYLSKTDLDGHVIWEKFYGDTQWDILSDACNFNDQIALLGTSKKDKSVVTLILVDKTGEIAEEITIHHTDHLESGQIHISNNVIFIGANTIGDHNKRIGHILQLTPESY